MNYEAYGDLFLRSCDYCDLQVPDSVMDTEKIDAVVLDEDAVGEPDGVGSGAKILRGEGALDMYLDNTKSSSKVIEPNCHLHFIFVIFIDSKRQQIFV